MRSGLVKGFVGLCVFGFIVCPAQAGEKEEHEHGHEHGAPAKFVPSTTYEDAVIEIEMRLHEITELIESKKLDQVHSQADVIKTVGNLVGQLALKPDSGVPRAKIKDVNVAGRGLASKFDAIDKAGDSGDLASTKKVFDEMVQLAGTLRKAVTPSSYARAMPAIENRLHMMDESISSENWDTVKSEAEIVGNIAAVLESLAKKDDSGVKKEAVTEIAEKVKTLQKQLQDIRSAAGAGTAEKVEEVHKQMMDTLTELKKFAPKVYACPMKCEGQKTYNAPGKCPKCGMELKELHEHTDHSPKHGGVFFMAPDKYHHLEGTLSAVGEFRIYFYDDFTRPITAEKFSAQATVTQKPGEHGKPITIQIGPGNAFLVGQVDPSTKPPLNIHSTIDFKDGQGAQVFDFDFREASRSAASESSNQTGVAENK